jgi:hypothetical protein
MCLIAEIVHTCSNEKVAQAAVASIGSDFSCRVKSTASAYGMTIGAFTAQTVRQFERSVGEDQKNEIRAVMRGADQPILSGLRFILKPAIETETSV